MSRYSEEFKEQAVRKMMALNAMPVVQVSLDTGVSEQALHNWRNRYRDEGKTGPASLVLIGGGPRNSDLIDYNDEYGVQHVHFADAVEYDEIPGCFAAANALIIPTSDDDGNLVVPTALACGMHILSLKYN